MIAIKKRDDFETEVDWLIHCADNGFTELQINLASNIVVTRTDAKRIIEAYKWLFIARFLGNEEAKSLILFLRLSMSEAQVGEADGMVNSWLDSKEYEYLEGKTTYWSQELKDSWGGIEARIKQLH